MEPDVHLVALDIETSGLDPKSSRVIAVGLATVGQSETWISSDERQLLHGLDKKAREWSAETMLVTWNGEEFDLPFLRARFRENKVPTSLVLRPRGQVGKYGKPLYSAHWGSIQHLDIAPYYRALAEKQHIPWRLKSIARSVLGIDPVEVDNRGEAIARLNKRSLKAYLQSDIEITLALAERIFASSDEMTTE